jgi:ribonuclease E
MDSPDEPRADRQAADPEAPTPDAATPAPGVVSPSRPRSSASFAGGAPPAAAPPSQEAPAPAPASPAPPLASFQVTTVERRSASRPAGPPPATQRARSATATPATDTPVSAPRRAAAPAAAPASAEPAPATPATAAAAPGQPDTETPATPRPTRSRRRGGAATQTSAPSVDAAAAADPDAATAAVSADAQATLTDAPDPSEASPAARPAARGPRQRSARPAEAAAAPADAGPAVLIPADDSAPAGEPAGDDGTGEAGTQPRRSRRRRGRGRGGSRPEGAAGAERPQGDEPPGPVATEPPAQAGDGEADDDEEGGSTRTRARRRRRAAARERARGGDEPKATEPAAQAAPQTAAPETAPRKRAPADAPTEPASVGSTRLASNRDGPGRSRRRRSTGLTEEQKRLLREDGPERRMLVTEGADRTQIGVIEGRELVEHYVTRKAGKSQVGNIYLGRVQNVLPGMEAAFVDVGKGRNAVLYAGEVTYNEEDLEGEAPRIERALKPGQAVLVQVTKDPIGSKGARLTTEISLAGRYLVLQPQGNSFGISRRLPEAERSRLRDILKEVRPKGLGLIVRTAAEGASADDLRADLARLQERWEQVDRKAKRSSAPSIIYAEPELVVRVIRDIFSPDFVELIVDAPELHQRVQSYLEEVAPDLLPKLRQHDGRLPLFEQYRVVEQIHKALERKVWLPSGGSIVIDRTEAMTVVDVNTGKFVGKSNLEETVVANNLEAADELVRQLRLRDIGGIVIIDFIDMLFERNQQAVIDRLKAALARDKTKSQVMDISPLGLVQMTRKRVSGGLLESFSEPCPTCEGRGIVITHEL